MHRIIDACNTGKTYKLMLLAKENNGVLVCANPVSMENKARGYELTGFSIISYFEYFKNFEKYKNKKCFIDELENFLKNSFGNNMEGYSITCEG